MAEATVMNKRILVAISHAIEQFALANDDGQMVVVAMFQRLTYFEREVEMYRRIASRAAMVLVGLAEEFPPRLPDGVAHVLLQPGEDLAREWSVTVLSGRAGASVRCTDLATVEPNAPTLESGRRFFGTWSFRRQDAYSEAIRLRGELRGRIAPEQLATLDGVLEQVLQQPGTAAEARADAALKQFCGSLDEALAQRNHLAHRLDNAEGHDRDPRTGLRTPEFIERFTAGSGAGTLPVALILGRLHGLARLKTDHGFRAEMALLSGLRRVLNGPLNDIDHAARIGPEEFLLLMPSRPATEAVAVQEAVARAVDDLGRAFPFVPLPLTSVLIRTRNRPLPLPEMYDALDDATRVGRPLTVLPAA